jgi:hypothetical protein
MGKSWEEMCQEVVIDGRPGDVASAALGWQELLKNLGSVKESLETNIKDLGTVWKGEAYKAFKTRIEQHAKDAGRMIEDAEKSDGIVLALNNAANKLTEAQREFPIPAKCVNDVLEARNGKLTLGIGFFEAKVAPDFLGWLDPISAVADWINDRSDEAAQVYTQVGNDYQNQAATMPGESRPGRNQDPDLIKPNLDDGGGGKDTLPKPPKLPDTTQPDLRTTQPDLRTTQPDLRTTQPDLPTTPPDVDSGLGRDTPGNVSLPSTGGLDEQYGSGLAGAGGSGIGSGGLPSTSGLGSGAGLGGGGAGSIPGGGALGRPVAPMMPPMMGGAAAGGKGAGKGAGGRLGAGAAGGMAGGMAGPAAGRGAGAGGRGAGAGARGAASGRGGAAGVGPGGSGAGYNEDDTPRNTWLEEDEDVWGAGGDGAPGVLH